MGLDRGYLMNLKKSTMKRTELEEISTANVSKMHHYWHGCIAEVSNRRAFSLGVVCSYKT